SGLARQEARPGSGGPGLGMVRARAKLRGSLSPRRAGLSTLRARRGRGSCAAMNVTAAPGESPTPGAFPMIPKPPPREGSLGFLFIPPYRIQGVSIAGEMTVVQAPELDIAFDMGVCPRSALASRYVAVSHGHMDHIGGLAYYCSQRKFQGMGVGSIICDTRVA